MSGRRASALLSILLSRTAQAVLAGCRPLLTIIERVCVQALVRYPPTSTTAAPMSPTTRSGHPPSPEVHPRTALFRHRIILKPDVHAQCPSVLHDCAGGARRRRLHEADAVSHARIRNADASLCRWTCRWCPCAELELPSVRGCHRHQRLHEHWQQQTSMRSRTSSRAASCSAPATGE